MKLGECDHSFLYSGTVGGVIMSTKKITKLNRECVCVCVCVCVCDKERERDKERESKIRREREGVCVSFQNALYLW